MAREVGKLKITVIEAAIKAGRAGMHSDGGGLYLRIDPRHGSTSWVYRYRDSVTSRLRDKGLGRYPDISLKDARQMASSLRTMRQKGIDPISALAAEREAKRASARPVTFGQCAQECLNAKKAGWRNAKHGQQWISTLETYASRIMAKPVATITRSDVLACIEKDWQTKIINSPVSRLVVDVERFHDDSQEIMAGIGMGAIYKVTHNLQPLRRPISEDERLDILNTWYHPHHERLSNAVDKAIERYGKALILDIHSYPKNPLPYEINSTGPRPQICIGTDDFHTSDALNAAALAAFHSTGLDTAFNSPFAGALVPSKHYHRDNRVQSLMIEIRRDLYMDESTGLPTEAFPLFKEKIHTALTSLAFT